MASYDAQINLILKGSSELQKLSSTLEAIENTASAIQDLFDRGVFGRVSDINTYIKALGQIEKSAAATRLQAAAIADVNAETKRALIVESQLRRERSRTARLSRAFEIETKGLDQTKGKLREIKEQFDEVSVALKSAFRLGDVRIISQLRNELSALVEDQREWNRTLAGTKNTGVNADFLKEQARGYAQQIEQLRKRALALSKNEEIIRRLAAAEFNLVEQRDKNTGAFTQFADPRLGRELLSNIKAQITAEEQLARERERFSGQYERQQKEARLQAISTAQTIAAIARKAGGATFDALTFGQGAKVARGARNAAIRGGLGLGALGLGGAYAATQEALGNVNLGPIRGPAVEAANAIGGAINNALGGVPGIINDMLSALGNVPGSLGLASVAALAFAPAMKTAADAVFLAGKRFGATKFGEDIKLTLDRQTNLFESVINKASEMSLEIGSLADKAKTAAEEMSAAYKALPRALPAAGETSFRGAVEYDPRIGAFAGGGARALNKEVQQTMVSGEKLNRIFGSAGSKIEFLADKSGDLAARSKESADTTRLFAEGLGEAVSSVDRIAVRLKEAKTYSERISVLLSQAFEQQRRAVSVAEADIQRRREARREVVFNRRSAEIARERSRFLLGAGYAVSQVPPGGELLPGGRTETRQKQYRDLLNVQAVFAQRAKEILATAESIENLERKLLGGVSENVAAKKRGLGFAKTEKITLEQINEENERSIQIIRERNKELRQRPIAAMTPQERVSQGILDPESLQANRKRRVEIGRLDPLERFYAGFQPRRLAARSARATSEGLVGGAFPLLFGQGIGAAALGGLGGAAGGFAGGGLGFGLSLVGTALGTAFDEAVQGAKELGDALQKPVENFDQLAEKSFFSSKALEDTIKKTIEYGDTATASALIQEEAIKKLGVGGVENLKTLGTESDRLNRAFAELGQQMQAVAAGPLASITGFFANIFGQAAAAGRVRLLRANLSQEQAGQFNQEVRQRLQQQGIQRGIFAPSAPTDAEIGMLQDRGALQDIVDKWQAIEIQGKIKLDPKQQIESEINALEKKLEELDIGKSLKDQFRSAEREQEDLDKQRADLVRSYEESIAQIRKSVEDKISQQRRQNAQTEIDIRSKAAALQLEKLKQANKEFRGLFSGTVASEVTERVLDAVEAVTSIQNQGASERARLELQIQNTAIDTEKYRLDVADQVSKLNEETARRVADIDEQVRRKNEEFNSRRFAIEKQIADLQLRSLQVEVGAAARDPNLPKKTRDEARQLYEIIGAQRAEVEQLSSPPALRGVGQVGGGGVSAFGLSQAVKDGIALQRSLQAIGDQIKSINSAEALSAIDEPLKKQTQQTDLLFSIYEQGGGARSKDLAAEVNLIQAINDKLAEQKDENSALAVKLRELRERENGRYKIITLINEAATAKTQEEQLQNLIDKEVELRAKMGLAKSGRTELSMVDEARIVFAQKGVDLEDERTKVILRQLGVLDSLKKKLNETTAAQEMQKELFDGITDAVAGTFRSAFDLAIQGSENLGESLRGLAADILATISKMLIMYAIAQALGALGGGNGDSVFSKLAKAFGYKGAANGAYFSDGVAAFANGGMFTNSIVSSPTLFKFADGGVTQMGEMGEAGPEAIMPLKRGPGGRLGVDASGVGGGDSINVVVNVDAKGTNVQGNDQQGNQLGRAISAAVQSELIKQKRPGGLLA